MQVQQSPGQLKGEPWIKDSLLQESLVSQIWAGHRTPTVLSDWLGASQEKHSLGSNAMSLGRTIAGSYHLRALLTAEWQILSQRERSERYTSLVVTSSIGASRRHARAWDNLASKLTEMFVKDLLKNDIGEKQGLGKNHVLKYCNDK